VSAEARSRAWALFAQALGYPEGELLEAIASGALRDALVETLGAVSPRLAAELEREALCVPGAGDALAAEYTRLFDVGTKGPPCPLHGGLWAGDRMKNMEEVLRFYRHFGLAVAGEAGQPGELPDHLALELEFLHYLAFRAHEAALEGGDAGSFARAERDFVARHPGRVVPLLRAKLAAQKAPAFYLALVGALAGLLTHAGAELGGAAAA
jgi:DMSO reductase family type II enzyme chaperone